MSKSVISFEEILSVVDEAINPTYLNKVQERVLQHTWEGKTYSEIAAEYEYDKEYVKSVGCELWQILSKSFGASINKNNFGQFMRRYLATKSVAQSIQPRHQDWGTAPDVSTFRGRTEELAQLQQWMSNERCRVVVISGMIGIGKSALAARFAQQVQDRFEYVIWRSLRNAPSIQETIDTFIHFFAHEPDKQLPDTLDGKIVQLLFYLRQHRCLLILDDLQSILADGDRCGYYRSGYEGYGQFFRSVSSTRHQSFVVMTSWDKPKGIILHQGDTVQLLVLKGLRQSTLQEIFQQRMQACEEEWQIFLERYAYNPQLLQIAMSTIQTIFRGNLPQFLRQKHTSEELRTLLDYQFDRLPGIEQKIGYWLAIKRGATSPEQMLCDPWCQSESATKLLEAFSSLEQRSLLNKNERGYTLQPIFLDYLSCRLIEKVCQNIIEENLNPLLNGHAHKQCLTSDQITRKPFL